MADVEKIALEKLTIDPEIQQRAEISEVAVAEYAESLDKLPPSPSITTVQRGGL